MPLVGYFFLPAPSPRGCIPTDLTKNERMARKLFAFVPVSIRLWQTVAWVFFEILNIWRKKHVNDYEEGTCRPNCGQHSG